MISIVVSTNNQRYWRRFCESLVPNLASLEVIMVGPCDPAPLPVPARFVKTDVNPSKCWQLGASIGGEHLCMAPDDVVFTPGFFDRTIKLAESMGRYDMFTARYVHNNVDQFGGMRLMSIQGMPLLPVCGVYRHDAHVELGGVDRRFNAVLWDTDLGMRLLEAGGTTTLVDDHVVHEVGHESTMFVRNYERDLAVIRSLWFDDDGQPLLNRRQPVESYGDEAISPTIWVG